MSDHLDQLIVILATKRKMEVGIVTEMLKRQAVNSQVLTSGRNGPGRS
jgi:hypothetical protein